MIAVIKAFSNELIQSNLSCVMTTLAGMNQRRPTPTLCHLKGVPAMGAILNTMSVKDD